MKRRNFIKSLFGVAAVPFIPNLPKIDPVVYWAGTRVPITEPMPLTHLQSVYYYRTAFDKHGAGIPKTDAELLARETCQMVFQQKRIAWPRVPWERYEEVTRLQRA